MALSSWFCTNNTKNMLVKIVHPGGCVELYDRPMLAAEIMLKNPRCCVTHPDVFRQPWEVLSPDSVLLLGQKYYVVPTSTLQKLQRGSSRRSPSMSPRRSVSGGRSPLKHRHRAGDGPDSSCWSITSKKNSSRFFYSCLSKSEDEIERGQRDEKDVGGEDKEGCLMCLLPGSKAKDEDHSSGDLSSSSESTQLNKKTSGENGKSRIKGLSFADQWQPSLDGIDEDHSI